MRLRLSIIVVSGVLAYLNGLPGAFMFDDENSIVSNQSIRSMSPLTVPLNPPRNTPVAGRPLVNLTFALNYAASGLDARAYRIVNMGVHLLSALVLFGIIRRTLLLPKLEHVLSLQRGAGDDRPERAGQKSSSRKKPRAPDADVQMRALNLAFACALIWTLHPLNTEVVNYLSQRTEGLMGLFYLVTVYCAIRSGLGARDSGLGRWEISAILSCAAGMACKESMVTAPVIVALYDRVFLFDSLKNAFRQRWRLYAGLAASWLVLAALMWGSPRTSAGLGSGTSPWIYFLNQIEIIVHYLRLTVWPRALVLDYGLPRSVTMAEVAVPAVLLVALGLATLIALRYRPFAGFALAWFFITLAPTSSFVPIATEVGAERRMYLPLAGLVALCVIGGYVVARRIFRLKPEATGIGLAGVCVLLAIGTFARNREYQTRLAMAETIVERRPHGRAHFLLGNELVVSGSHERGLAELRASSRDYAGAQNALDTELFFAGDSSSTITHAREFIRLLPDDAAVVPARELMGRAYIAQGNLDAAAEQFTLIVQNAPSHSLAQMSLGEIRFKQRRLDEAIRHYESALQSRVRDPDILGKLGVALATAGRIDQAIGVLGQAVEARPDDASLLNLLGRALAAQGRFREAATQFRRALDLAPHDAETAKNLATAEKLALQ